MVYECTWRGCSQRETSISEIESHVRSHLGRPDPRPGETRDFEEEFYYTEYEVDTPELMQSIPELNTSVETGTTMGWAFTGPLITHNFGHTYVPICCRFARPEAESGQPCTTTT